MEFPKNTLFFEHLNWHGKMPGLMIFIDPSRYEELTPAVYRHFSWESQFFFQMDDPRGGNMLVEFWGRPNPLTVNQALNMANELGLAFVECESWQPLLLSPPFFLDCEALDVLFEDGNLFRIVRFPNGIIECKQVTFCEDPYSEVSVSMALINLRQKHGRIVEFELRKNS
ncbi:MAG: hypothetical protein WC824_15435 [Bacteroidota bacterium]|jgi:hypothetical protein